MKKTIASKIICILIASLFLVNNLAYGLAPAPGTTRQDVTDEFFALGQKKFAAKVGPGIIDFDAVKPGTFTPTIEPQVDQIKLVKTDYSNPPKGWENNALLQETDLLKAFEHFRDEEAQIPSDLLSIEVGVFEVKDGELPIACIENRGGSYVLVLHKDFVRMWNDIRKNDVWFECTFPDGETRTLSLAWGIFYRVAKHEMGDLDKNNKLLLPKSLGHFNYYPEMLASEVLGREHEFEANEIAGRYNIMNDAIWAWFLGSYCFANSTRYNNDILKERLNWFFDGKEALEMGLNLEFPNLLKDEELRKYAIQLALFCNYHFFSCGAEATPIKESSPINEESIGYQQRYEERKPTITETIYATGEDEEGAGTITHDIYNLRQDGGIRVDVGDDSKESL